MTNRISRTLLLLAAVTLSGGSAWAQAAAPADPGGAPARAARSERDGMAVMDRHIAGLQRRLKITPAQQPQWDAFTAVMRQNATHMETLQRDRADKVAAMTAPEDMRSYADVARAHADDLQRLIPAFDELYASMTPEQKAVADRTFHEFQGRAGRGRARPS
jgi:Skp family chaperone for outer membrane proteins